MPVGQPCPARLEFETEEGMGEELCDGCLPLPRPLEVPRRRRERPRQSVAACLRPCRTEVLIERRRAKDMEILIRRALFLPIAGAVHRRHLPVPGEPREIVCSHIEIRLGKTAAPLQAPVPRHKYGEEKQEESAQHQLGGGTNIPAVNRRGKHQREYQRARENVPRPLRMLHTRMRKHILPYIFIVMLLQKDTPCHSCNMLHYSTALHALVDSFSQSCYNIRMTGGGYACRIRQMPYAA